ETTRGIGAALRALLDADPADAEALRYRATFLQGIARVIDSARSPATLEQIEPILIQVRAQLGGGDDIAALDREFSAATQRLQAAERERLAASSGVLVLNAQPWASIESVVEQASGTRVALPGDASTPLRLTVPAGTYRIAFRHPSAPDPVVLVGTVSARQADLVSARFPTLTAERFLRDAGWSP